jgi:hypothetical protein
VASAEHTLQTAVKSSTKVDPRSTFRSPAFSRNHAGPDLERGMRRGVSDMRTFIAVMLDRTLDLRRRRDAGFRGVRPMSTITGQIPRAGQRPADSVDSQRGSAPAARPIIRRHRRRAAARTRLGQQSRRADDVGVLRRGFADSHVASRRTILSRQLVVRATLTTLLRPRRRWTRAFARQAPNANVRRHGPIAAATSTASRRRTA